MAVRARSRRGPPPDLSENHVAGPAHPAGRTPRVGSSGDEFRRSDTAQAGAFQHSADAFRASPGPGIQPRSRRRRAGATGTSKRSNPCPLPKDDQRIRAGLSRNVRGDLRDPGDQGARKLRIRRGARRGSGAPAGFGSRNRQSVSRRAPESSLQLTSQRYCAGRPIAWHGRRTRQPPAIDRRAALRSRVA